MRYRYGATYTACGACAIKTSALKVFCGALGMSSQLSVDT